jgi:hypothetical protein
VKESTRRKCQTCGVFLVGAVTALCAACMPIEASAGVSHQDQEIAALVAEHTEPLHIPHVESAVVRDDLNPAAFPPPAASPFVQPRAARGRPAQRTRGRAYGQYVIANEDGTTRLVRFGMA